MTKLEALIQLRDKVKAGDEPVSSDVWNAMSENNRIGSHGLQVVPAYHGSLDAAKALHEAVLPGWGWAVFGDGTVRVDFWDGNEFEAESDTPARAWLLAILEALISQEQQ